MYSVRTVRPRVQLRGYYSQPSTAQYQGGAVGMVVALTTAHLLGMRGRGATLAFGLGGLAAGWTLGYAASGG